MKYPSTFLLLIIFCLISNLNAQESEDYVEFNDRNNTVHGVYLGIGTHYGVIDKKYDNNAETYSSNFKVAYVLNQQFEIGLVAVWFHSSLKKIETRQAYGDNNNAGLYGGYGGLHLEPILFSSSKVNLSFPLLIGAGGVSLDEGRSKPYSRHYWKRFYVAEPGINVLYNINRYIQLEAGVKYRLSSKLNFKPEYDLTRINGFSGGLGVKVGVFNMGRNRYK